MQLAGTMLIGRHDLSTFRAALCQAASPVKTIDHLSVERDGEAITIDVRARSFLHHQVRNIAGSLVLVGRGKWSQDDFAERSLPATAAAAAPPPQRAGCTWLRSRTPNRREADAAGRASPERS